VLAVAIYAAFITVLYLRMSNAMQKAAEYSSASLCILPSNCREIVKVQVIDHEYSKLSFINYGARGLPVQKGSFQKYIFVVKMDGSEDRTVIVQPNIPASVGDFDLQNIYLPVKSDGRLLDENLLKDKSVYVEIWRDKITLILVKPIDETQLDEGPAQSDVTLVPSTSAKYEMILPTDENPVVLLKYSQNDFNGWTMGVLSMVVLLTITSGISITFINGLTWVDSKWRHND
jgi:hypothetical protein